ncbi:autotransporter domain-containing protein [Candidatus Symbiopectobacterium sp. NZEC127]|uniref:autotransporter family protein n=2 Tax=unclassified Symbiopectobacterium TaxID=2794573 RepID=UPI002227A66E|nr:autotransporter outer membrane beta-barrel domain-containing protein [Candidatus Symbiopectobacterium sp. NZEC127]MCW2486203.1 autotransporter domain-containing protein [Candidatus Symbiopectobacterium sp. NZEC127]
MRSSSFKVKPLVVAVSAVLGVLSTYPSSAASIDVSTSQGGLSITTAQDYLSITNTGTLTGTDFGITNTSTIGSLSNAGVITGNDGIYNTGSIGPITNSGLISASDNIGLWSDAGNIDSLFNTGTITGHKGVYLENNSFMGEFKNTGYIEGDEDTAVLVNASNLCYFENSGEIYGDQGVVLENDSMLYELVNSGTISSENDAAILLNSSSIYSISNTGLITGDEGIVLENDASIESLINGGTISAGLGIGVFGDNVEEMSSIGSISNTGLIDAEDGLIVAGGGYVGTFFNSGTLSANLAIGAFGNPEYAVNTITAIHNSGLIDAEEGLVVAGGSYVGTFFNTGSIDTNIAMGIYDGGTLGSLSNEGIIGGELAALSIDGGSIGSIYNDGVIAGNIYSTSGLTFFGGKDEDIGTLTGYDKGSIGTISIAAGDLTFVTGSTLLNDNVILGEGQLVNGSAQLMINNVLTIDGDYQQGGGASLLFGVNNYLATNGDINSYNGYGRLVVSGSANITSGSNVGLMSNGQYAFAQGQRYVVIRANSDGTDYNADKLDYWADNYTGMLTGNTVTHGSTSDLVVTLGDCNGDYKPVGYATTSNAVSSLNGLFNYGGTESSLLNLFNAGAAVGNTAEANRAGAQLSPAAIASASAQAAALPAMSVLDVLAQRGEAIRLAGAGSGISTGENDDGPVAWGQGFGGKVNRGQQGDIAGYDGHFVGVMLGGDGEVNDNWRLGGLGSYTTTMVNSSGDNLGSSAHVKSYGVFGYANYEGDPWYVNLTTGGIFHHYGTKRQIDFTGFNGNATAGFKGNQFVASGLVGYPLSMGTLWTRLTPIAALTYSKLGQDGYTESGGNGAGLRVDDTTVTSLKSDLALKLDHRFKMSDGEIQPFIQGGWRHEYHDDALQSVASFSADSTGASSFVARGSKPIVDTGVFSAGVSLVGSRDLSVTIKYTGEAARHYQSHTGNLQLRWQF